MRFCVAGTILIAACQFNPDNTLSSDSEDSKAADASVADASDTDAGPGSPDAATGPDSAAGCPAWSMDTSLFTPCQDISEVSVPLSLGQDGTYLYDTSDGSLLGPDKLAVAHTTQVLLIDGVSVPVLVASQININSDAILRGRGPNPFVLISWSTIRIDGLLDVSSHHRQNQTRVGAGANSSNCLLAGNGVVDNGGGSGGGGGGFAALGGTGGTGDSNDQDDNGTPGGAGGQAFGAALGMLPGGCMGGSGGRGDGDASDLGGGGMGGGAVQLIANIEISLAGIIHAGGEGGFGAINRAGGGGGGSGGLIRLEAASVQLLSNSTIAANGGGGGGGASGGNSGQSGIDGKARNMIAEGGANGGNGRGGSGGFLNQPTGQSANDNGNSNTGAAGGGGGVGYVQIISPTQTISPNAVVSPAASPP